MSRYIILQHFRNTTYGIVLGILGLLLVSASFLMPSAQALTLNLDARDCDNNAVIKCGAASTSELLQKYNNQADVRAIFNHFGISPSEMSRIGSTAVGGVVDRNGTVTVNGKVVATNARTAGRQNMSGSTPIQAGGTQFYMRSPNVSFQTQRLKAFVVMTNTNTGGASDNNRNNNSGKRFAFAIIASCGNPVKAQPKPIPKPAPVKPISKPKPQPQPQQPKPQPAPQQPQEQAQSQSQQQSASATANATANVTINQEKPQPPQPETKTVVERVEVPVPVVVQQPAQAAPAPAQELPKTGMENVSSTLGIAGLATLLGTVAHLVYTRRKLIR